MANRLYNKQVSPKGYKAGGSVKEDPMRDRKKQPLRTKSGGTKGKPNLFDPAFKSKKRKTEGFKMGGRAKKMGGGMMMQRPMMQKGGSLKPVQPNQKGLSKLPTEVRNKMGYMKKEEKFMANRLYNKQVSPKGYQEGGKVGKVRSFLVKLEKKIAPTFGEQFSDAKKKGKKTFKSTRDDTTKGKLEYSTKTAAEVKAAKKRMSDRERARVGDKSKQLSEKGAAFKLARKSGKKTFTHKGKKFSTLLKGEKSKKIMPELSGKTSKKIKKFIGA